MLRSDDDDSSVHIHAGAQIIADDKIFIIDKLSLSFILLSFNRKIVQEEFYYHIIIS